MKLAIALATACAVLSAPAFAQSQTAPSTTGAPIGTVSASDLVTGVIMADMFAVQLAQLARKQGDNSNTTFAYEEMPADTKATNDLKMLARTVNLSIPTALDREHQQKLELLRNLSGNQFNNAFRNDEVQSTWDEIYLADVYAKKGNNADLKNWASTNLPKLRDQLNKAEKLS